MSNYKQYNFEGKAIPGFNVDLITYEDKQRRISQERWKKQGTRKFNSVGIEARLLGREFLNYDNLSDGDKLSYRYGYYQDGNRILNLIIMSNKVPERFQNILVNDNITPEEILQGTGYRDSLDSNIIFEQLPDKIQNNLFYQYGYQIGLEESQEKSKRKR